MLSNTNVRRAGITCFAVLSLTLSAAARAGDLAPPEYGASAGDIVFFTSPVPTQSNLLPSAAGVVRVWQQGDGNLVDIVQQGSGSYASVRQLGDGNGVDILQRGAGHYASVIQEGNSNLFSLTQSGLGQSLEVVQWGNGLSVQAAQQ